MKELLKKILWLFPWFGELIYKKELRVLRNSRYFDEKYYYFLRPDVFNSKRDSALHYLLYGWKEGVNPSEYFNTAEYLNAYPDVNFNPLLHYEWFGKNENRNAVIKPFPTERISFLQDETRNARRQTAEIQLAVQEEILKHNNTKQIEELKKQLLDITNSLQSKLQEQQNAFESKLQEQQNSFESKLEKLQLEQERTFLNYQKSEHEKTVAREENTLKLQRDLFEMERKNSDLQNKINDNTAKLEKVSNLEMRINSVDAKHSQKLRASEESLWADIFNQTVNDSIWLKNKTFSPGRWAVGYPYLYVMYRVLNEIKPTNILELGLGVSTKIIGQYAAHYNNINHIVVENDSEWIDFFNRDFKLSNNTKIEQLDWVFEPFEEADSVRVFDNFQARFSNKKFDFISIDAPLGGDMKKYARIDVCRLLPHCLKESFVIMIDDYERIGEKNTVEKMKEELNNAGIKFKTGVYSGKKDLLIFTSEDLKFLCSM